MVKKDSDNPKEVKQVSISLPKEFHDFFTDFADDREMGFSALVRQALFLYKDHHENDGIPSEFLWLETKLDDIQQTLEQLVGLTSEIVEEIQPNQSQMTLSESGQMKEVQTVVEELKPVFKRDKNEMWTVLELSEQVDRRPEWVKKALRVLKDSYEIRSVDGEESSKDVDEWTAR